MRRKIPIVFASYDGETLIVIRLKPTPVERWASRFVILPPNPYALMLALSNARTKPPE